MVVCFLLNSCGLFCGLYTKRTYDVDCKLSIYGLCVFYLCIVCVLLVERTST